MGISCTDVIRTLTNKEPIKDIFNTHKSCQEPLMEADKDFNGIIEKNEIPVALKALENYEANLRTQVLNQNPNSKPDTTNNQGSSTAISYKKIELKDNKELSITHSGNKVTFSGKAKDCGLIQNFELQNDPAFRDKRFTTLIIKVDSFKNATDTWGDKGFRIDINGKTIEPPAKWNAGDNFFRMNESGEIKIPITDPKGLALMPNNIQIMNGAGKNIGFSVSISFLNEGKEETKEPSVGTKTVVNTPEKKVSATEYTSALKELKKILEENTARNHYFNPNSSMYNKTNDGLLVRYEDSRSIVKSFIFPKYEQYKAKVMELFSNDLNSEVLTFNGSVTYEQITNLSNEGVPDSLLVILKKAYIGIIHTEGYVYDGHLLTSTPPSINQFYTTFLLSQDYSEHSQKMFDKLCTSSEAHFTHIRNKSILSWIAGEDDSAADADVYRITNFFQAAQNQKAGKWKTNKLDYEQLYKQANSDFLENGVIYVKNSQGKILVALPSSGTNNDPKLNKNTGSHFVIDTGTHYVFQYNQSYSYSYAASLLKDTDPKWGNIVETQNKINKIILDTYGIVDWCEVTINKTTGEIAVSDNLDKYFPNRYGGRSKPNPDGQHLAPRIEWPRFILDHALNYLKFNDAKSLEMINEIVKRYGSDLKGGQYNNKNYNELLYSGFRNELLVSLSTVLKVITKQLDDASLKEFKNEVLGGKDYYGKKDYNSLKHTFQQLLVATMLKGLEGIDSK